MFIQQIRLVTLGMTVLLLFTGCSDKKATVDKSRNIFPPQGFVSNADKGVNLFAQHCAQCHGQGGKGTDQGPPLIHKIYEPGHHGDVSFYMAVGRGVKAHHWQFGNMAPLPHVAPKDVAHIIAYIRREQQKAGIF